MKTNVETEVLALADLKGATYNPREIAPAAMRGLSESLTKLGLLDLPVVNVRNGQHTIVGGHQRVASLKAEGFTHARCVVVRFDDVAERAANLTLNNPAVRGTWDPLKAVPLLNVLMPTLTAPSVMGFDVLDADLRRQLKLLEAGSTPADGAAGAPPEKPKSKAGEVYVLGDHRLVCGPFEQHLAKLLGKKEAAACITDPPYNVAYESAAGETIQGDRQAPEQWLAFLDTLAQVVLAATSGPCFLFMASRELPALDAAWRKNRGAVARWLFWAKSSFTLGRGDYHHAHEPLLYGARATVTLPAFAHDVLEYPKPSSNELHPTAKPIELIEELLRASTQPGDLVIDPFVGSGTTLAVAQANGRVCYASEVDPRYCDVTRKRWAEQVHGVGCDWVKVTKG